MAEHNAVVRVYDPHAETEASNKELQRSGFDINKLSVVGKDYLREQHVIGFTNARDPMKVCCQLGDFWGGLSGLLFGLGFFLIPGIGPLIVFGPLVSWIIRAMESAARVGELSALGAGLRNIGVPKNSILEYETALKSDKFLVIAHITAAVMAKAQSIFDTTGAAQIAAQRGVNVHIRHRLLGEPLTGGGKHVYHPYSRSAK